MSDRFGPSGLSDLPDSVAIFPLPGILLLPGGILPLNIFEPRYLQMTEEALMSRWRLIGMIQPQDASDKTTLQPAVQSLGCAGRIIAFKETDDGRILLTLRGVCRFGIAEELPHTKLYRQVRPIWGPYAHDFGSPDSSLVDRERLLKALKPYLEVHGLKAEWEALESVAPATLVTSLSMMCPLEARDKQALLEAQTLKERSELLTAFIEMAVMQKTKGPSARQ